MKKIALLGCGAINTIIAEYIQKQGFAEIVGVYDIYPEAAQRLVDKLEDPNIKVIESFVELLMTQPDMVIEAASPEAAAKYDPMILEQADVISLDTGIMSTQYEMLKAITKRTGNRIYFPSGAIGGLDAILAMAEEGIEELTIVTTKKPSSLNGYKHITERTEIFSGSASEAIKKFPRNVNVAITLSFAAGEEAIVKIIADPDIKYNQHEIHAKSKHTEFYSKITNIPSEDNPKTSYVAALSAVQMLKQALACIGGVKIGN